MINEASLTQLFAHLGAHNPSQWGRSQIEGGLPQLARFLFLRQAWKLVVPEGDRHWIDAQNGVSLDGPGGAIAPALCRVLAQGVDPADLTTIVRVMQWQLLSGLCYLLDDPGDLEPAVKDVAWRLFQIDEQDRPIAVMGALHESVLATDPSGNEMRGD